MAKRKKRNKKKNKDLNNILILIGISLVIVLSLVGYWYLFLPRMELNKGKVIYWDYKEKFKDPGYKAFYKDKDLTKKVKVKSDVNPDKVADYKVTYTFKVGKKNKKFVRTVKVRDLSAPKIELPYKGDIYVCPGNEYEGKDFKATDIHDGDVTKKVKMVKTRKAVTFTVGDKAGNYSSVTKKIVYKDKDAPKLTLNGGNYEYITIGEEYKDPGFKIVDNCDKGLEENVKIEGLVNTKEAGEYKLTYVAKDSSGNESKATRTVSVIKHGLPGTIYLTFDDGPQAGTTDVILDILKEENVKATFFLTGVGPDELIKRMHDEGHTVALHTQTHNYSYLYSSVDNYFEDLYNIQARVKRITGVESKIIRFPGGSSNTVSRRYTPGIMTELTAKVVNKGFKYYDWNVSSGDAGETTSPDKVYSNVINGLSKNRINNVLMHDIKPYTRDALRKIIKYGKENGYVFEKIIDQTPMVKQRVNN